MVLVADRTFVAACCTPFSLGHSPDRLTVDQTSDATKTPSILEFFFFVQPGAPLTLPLSLRNLSSSGNKNSPFSPYSLPPSSPLILHRLLLVSPLLSRFCLSAALSLPPVVRGIPTSPRPPSEAWAELRFFLVFASPLCTLGPLFSVSDEFIYRPGAMTFPRFSNATDADRELFLSPPFSTEQPSSQARMSFRFVFPAVLPFWMAVPPAPWTRCDVFLLPSRRS